MSAAAPAVEPAAERQAQVKNPAPRNPGLTPARTGASNRPLMSTPAPGRPPRTALRQLPALACALGFGLFASGARAQTVKPWTPAHADSVTGLAAEAKVRFRQATSDTVDENSIVPFERVGQAARRLLRRLGRDHTLLAPSIQGTLDSLGLDVDVVNDPELPSIVLVMIRNPYRRTQQAVGYLLWYRGVDLRMQGASFPPCTRPRLKAWWSGRPTSPYSAAIVYDTRDPARTMGFKYLTLSGDGFYWDLVQYEGNGPSLGPAGDVAFPDLNGDGKPELISYSPAPPDSNLTTAPPVQPILREAIYTELGRGFQVHDARVVPGPLATLDLFLNWLREGKAESARHLLVTPALVDQALQQGWADLRSPRNFLVDQQQEDQAWPEWLSAQVKTKAGAKRWVFHFTLQDGHWLIKDWVAEETPRTDAARVALPDSTGGRKP